MGDLIDDLLFKENTMLRQKSLPLILAVCLAMACASAQTSAPTGIIAPGAEVEMVQSGYVFLEGPAADAEGNLFFSDPQSSKDYKLSLDGTIELVRENTNMANGHYFAANGDLVQCETLKRRLIAVTPAGEIKVLADKFDGKKFNNTNDLWIDPRGGIYFSDPFYVKKVGSMEQSGEHVYYLMPDRNEVLCVDDDLARPNGLIGTDDGKTLYVADLGKSFTDSDGVRQKAGRKTYAYDIQPDGTLKNKRLFANQGADGVTLDENGNLYLTGGSQITVYDPKGEVIVEIKIPEAPANVTFAGKDRKTLYICARTSLYSLKMAVRGHKTQFEY